MSAREEAEKIVSAVFSDEFSMSRITTEDNEKLRKEIRQSLEERDEIIAGCVLQLDSLTDLPTTQRNNVKVFLQYLKDKGYA